VAGYLSRGGNTLVSDFISVARKLEELGFIYSRGSVIVDELFEEAGDV